MIDVMMVPTISSAARPLNDSSLFALVMHFWQNLNNLYQRVLSDSMYFGEGNVKLVLPAKIVIPITTTIKELWTWAFLCPARG